MHTPKEKKKDNILTISVDISKVGWGHNPHHRGGTHKKKKTYKRNKRVYDETD